MATHLTTTGPNAGATYCGTSREWARTMGDTFCHFTTAPVRWLKEEPRKNGVCVICHGAVTGRIGAEILEPADVGQELELFATLEEEPG